MDKNNIKDYFEQYIKTYPAYKNEKMFTALTDNLVDYYYDDLYNNIPTDLKTLYENQEVTQSMYNKFLIAIGVPEAVVNKLANSEKLVFLRSLSDFRRYKGSVDFFQKVGISFRDSFNIYELYIDWDTVENDWCFKPVIVHEDEKLDVVEEKIPFDEVYHSVPSFLVNRDELNALKSNGQLVLPIKSNILLLDQSVVERVSMIYNIIISTFIKEYRNNYIPIYFNEKQFSLNLELITYLWTFLACKYYNTNWLSFSARYILEFNTFRNPYKIDDLEKLIAEYDELETNVDVKKFYAEKISNFFGTHSVGKDMSLEQMENYVKSTNLDIWQYITDRVEAAEDDDITGSTEVGRRELVNIINEIYNSLILYFTTTKDEKFVKYFDYYLSSLPQLSVMPEDTTSYMLLYNFKPYHTELMSKLSKTIISDDKFNGIYPSDTATTLFELVKYNTLESIDDAQISMDITKTSDVQMVSTAIVNSSINQLAELSLLDYINTTTTINYGSVEYMIALKKDFDMIKQAIAISDVNDVAEFKENITRTSEYSVLVKTLIKSTLDQISALMISDVNTFKNVENIPPVFLQLETFKTTDEVKKINQKYVVSEKSPHIINNEFESTIDLSDNFTIT